MKRLLCFFLMVIIIWPEVIFCGDGRRHGSKKPCVGGETKDNNQKSNNSGQEASGKQKNVDTVQRVRIFTKEGRRVYLYTQVLKSDFQELLNKDGAPFLVRDERYKLRQAIARYQICLENIEYSVADLERQPRRSWTELVEELSKNDSKDQQKVRTFELSSWLLKRDVPLDKVIEYFYHFARNNSDIFSSVTAEVKNFTEISSEICKYPRKSTIEKLTEDQLNKLKFSVGEYEKMLMLCYASIGLENYKELVILADPSDITFLVRHKLQRDDWQELSIQPFLSNSAASSAPIIPEEPSYFARGNYDDLSSLVVESHKKNSSEESYKRSIYAFTDALSDEEDMIRDWRDSGYDGHEPPEDIYQEPSVKPLLQKSSSEPFCSDFSDITGIPLEQYSLRAQNRDFLDPLKIARNYIENSRKQLDMLSIRYKAD